MPDPRQDQELRLRHLIGKVVAIATGIARTFPTGAYLADHARSGLQRITTSVDTAVAARRAGHCLRTFAYLEEASQGVQQTTAAGHVAWEVGLISGENLWPLTEASKELERMLCAEEDVP